MGAGGGAGGAGATGATRSAPPRGAVAGLETGRTGGRAMTRASTTAARAGEGGGEAISAGAALTTPPATTATVPTFITVLARPALPTPPASPAALRSIGPPSVVARASQVVTGAGVSAVTAERSVVRAACTSWRRAP
jgi:hypothetical protein